MDTYWRRARIERVIDGDTVEATIDLGFHLTARYRLRLLGIDTPELSAKDPAERDAARAAREFVEAWWGRASAGTVDAFPIDIRTEKADSFGRYLAEVLWAGVSLNEALVTAGLAKRR